MHYLYLISILALTTITLGSPTPLGANKESEDDGTERLLSSTSNPELQNEAQPHLSIKPTRLTKSSAKCACEKLGDFKGDEHSTLPESESFTILRIFGKKFPNGIMKEKPKKEEPGPWPGHGEMTRDGFYDEKFKEALLECLPKQYQDVEKTRKAWIWSYPEKFKLESTFPFVSVNFWGWVYEVWVPVGNEKPVLEKLKEVSGLENIEGNCGDGSVSGIQPRTPANPAECSCETTRNKWPSGYTQKELNLPGLKADKLLTISNTVLIDIKGSHFPGNLLEGMNVLDHNGYLLTGKDHHFGYEKFEKTIRRCLAPEYQTLQQTWDIDVYFSAPYSWRAKVYVPIKDINCVSDKLQKLSGLGDIDCEKNLRTNRVDPELTQDDLQRAVSRVQKGEASSQKE